MGGGLLGGGRQLLHRVSTGLQPAQAGGSWRRGPGSARPPPHRPRTSAGSVRDPRLRPASAESWRRDAGSPGSAPAVVSNRFPWRRHLGFLRLFGVFRRVFVGELAAPSLSVIAAGGALPCRAPAEVDGGFVILSGSWLWTQPREVLQVKGFQCLFPETGLSGWSCLA